jgi:hypothetical protein
MCTVELVFERKYWTVTLTDGNVIRVRADSFSEADGDHIFYLMAEATPVYDAPFVFIPSIVERVLTD